MSFSARVVSPESPPDCNCVKAAAVGNAPAVTRCTFLNHDGGSARVIPGNPSSCLPKTVPGVTPVSRPLARQPAVSVTNVKPPGATMTRPDVVPPASLEPLTGWPVT